MNFDSTHCDPEVLTELFLIFYKIKQKISPQIETPFKFGTAAIFVIVSYHNHVRIKEISCYLYQLGQ